MSTKVNLAESFAKIKEYWSPRIAGELNDSYVKLAKLKGEFIWHHHDEEDELFLIINGVLRILLAEEEIVLHPGEFIIIPRGAEHKPVADGEVQVMLLELKTTRNTGNIVNERTTPDQWIV